MNGANQCIRILLYCSLFAVLTWGACSSNTTPSGEEGGKEAHSGNEKGVVEKIHDAGGGDKAAEKTVEKIAELPKEAIKKKYSFPGEKVECKVNQSFEALKPILAGGKNNPTGRGEHGSIYDPCNDRVILFGGNDFQPQQCADFGPKRFKADTWIYVLEYKNWVRLKTTAAPQARGRQNMAFDKSRKLVYFFGGRYRAENATGSYTMFNDMWAFDVNTDTWKELNTKGAIPTPRANAAMIYDDLNDRVILFGGSSSPSGLSFFALNDLYTLNLETLEWTKHSSAKSPSARLFHTMVMDGKHNRALIYGGGGNNAFTGPFYNDIWALDLKTLQWSEAWKKDANNIGPPARINTALVEDRDNGRIIMFAGHDDTTVGHRNDMWVYYTSQGLWQLKKAGDTGTGSGCSSFCRCSPDFVQVDADSPERREYHTFVAIEGQKKAILFGGKTDCGYIDDTWHLDLENYGWTEINAASQGEACKRTGRQDCKELCY